MKNKYTVYGDADFDKKIDEDMQKIVKAVLDVMPEEYLTALILGGGYGRGEGGVFLQDGKMELYNDYDFFVISNNLSRAKMQEYHQKLFEVGEKLTEEIGIDVDFGPFRNKSVLSKMKFTMMWFELKQAHVVVYGDQNVLDAIPDFKAEAIPFSEALSLMLNRAVGLILAEKRLIEAGEELVRKDQDFIERNIYKAAMAAGDAYLIGQHTFDHSYVKRMDLMDNFKEDSLIKENDFLELYKRSIMYKLKPERKDLSVDDLKKLHSQVKKLHKSFYLYTAGKCWDREFKNFQEYIQCLSVKVIEQGTPIQVLKNIALNLKEVGIRSFSFTWFLRYPRYRLFYVIPYFAFSYQKPDLDIASALGVALSSSAEEKYQRFIKLWERFN